MQKTIHQLLQGTVAILALSGVSWWLYDTYYFDYIESIDRYPLRFEGLELFLVLVLIFIILSYFAILFLHRNQRDLQNFFAPTVRKILLAFFMFILTPLANFVWIPIPIFALIFADSFPKDPTLLYTALGAAALGAYAFSCIMCDKNPRWVSLSLVLYLFCTLLITTVLAGITYI